QIRLAQIIVETEQQAEQIIKDVAKGIEFKILAKERSLDKLSSDQGGDLGWMDQGDPFIHSSIMDAAEELQIGEISDPISLGDSYAVIKLLERKITERKADYEVREALRKSLALDEAPSM